MTNIDTNHAGAAGKPAPGRTRLADTARTGPRPAASKSAAVLKMLARTRGAMIVDVATATGWQPHSVRAYFSGLWKKGIAGVQLAADNSRQWQEAPAPLDLTGNGH